MMDIDVQEFFETHDTIIHQLREVDDVDPRKVKKALRESNTILMKVLDTVSRATELEYLRWFYENADFGPADEDVRHTMDEEFMDETGKYLPISYDEE